MGQHPTPSVRRVSPRALQELKNSEGLRLVAYQDSVGVWTIGYGTIKGVHKGLVISEKLAEMLLQYDLMEYEEQVDRFLPRDVSQSCFDAYVMLAYNVGWQGVESSTSVRELKLYLETKEHEHLQRAWDSFLWWNKAGGKVLAGLAARRKRELDHWRFNRGG